MGFFTEIGKKILKFTWNQNKPQKAEAIMNQNNSGVIIQLDFKIC